MLFAVAETVTGPPAWTVDGSMEAMVVPPMLFSASVTAMPKETAAVPLAATAAAAEVTSEVMLEVSVAVTETVPKGASTSLSEMSAEISLVVEFEAFAPAPAPDSAKLPLPATEAEAATATASIVFMPLSRHVDRPGRAVRCGIGDDG